MATTFSVLSLGTAADLDTVEGNNDAENASALVGMTFGGPGNALSANIASMSPGTGGFSGGVATAYDQDNSPAENFSIDGGPDQVFDSVVAYNATLTYADGTTATISAVIFQDTAGNLYLAPEFSTNADSAAMEAQAIQSLTLDSVLQSTSISGLNGDRLATDFVPCFTSGTLIRTDVGEVPVEDLQVGGLVQTVDHGLQPIRWIGSRKLDVIDLFLNPKVRPIHIRAGALGDNTPSSSMTVSPQHRMLLRSKISERMFGAKEILVPAVKLLQLEGVSRVEDTENVVYFHVLFDQHEVIIANGAESESLYLGDQAMIALTLEAREEIEFLFPALCDGNYTANTARPIIRKQKKVRTLLERHHRNQKPLIEAASG